MLSSYVLSACSEMETRKVLVVHSYEKSYAAYPDFNEMIAETFRKRGIDAELRTVYLDCEAYQDSLESLYLHSLLDEVSENWEQLKLREKGGNKSVLSGVPAALPSLIKAHRIQDKARNVGFDWEEREQVWDKVKEEIQEFQAEVANMDKDKAEAEFGDVLFSLINAARLYKINPDNALERTNQKFINRFNYLEVHTIKEGKNLHDMTLEEMDVLWNEAKKLEK